MSIVGLGTLALLVLRPPFRSQVSPRQFDDVVRRLRRLAGALEIAPALWGERR